MREPWGISGPWFLALYVVGYGATMGFAFVVEPVVSWIGRVIPRRRIRLDPYRTAFLAGGAWRVGETAIAALVLRGQILVSRQGGLIAVRGETVNHPIESLAYDMVCNGRGASDVKQVVGRSSLVQAIRDELVKRRLFIKSWRLRCRWTVPLVLPLAVWIGGLVREIGVARMGRLSDLLFWLLLVTGLGLINPVIIMMERYDLDVPTARGRRYLRRLARSSDALGVAAFGVDVLADAELRTAMLRPDTRYRSLRPATDDHDDPEYGNGGCDGCGA